MTDLHARIDSAAHSGASGINGYRSPTKNQAKAGNYRLGRVQVHGLWIGIETPRGQPRIGWEVPMKAHYGHFSGYRGADGDGVDCFIGPAPEGSQVWVINQNNADGGFDEHKVMLGFTSEDEARNAYKMSYSPGWNGLGSMIHCTFDQLKYWLKKCDKTVPFNTDNFPAGEVKMNSILDALDNLDDNLDSVIEQLNSDDPDGLILDALTIDDIFEDSDGEDLLDAIVLPYSQMKRKMELLMRIIKGYSNDVQPVNLTITKPFKQRGTTNIAAVFEMSDGQTISIFFHNPDITPNKVMPTDELVSWKWMLNKKDVTILVAPERGEQINVRDVTRRIVRIVEKNSDRFVAANKNRAATMQAVEEQKKRIELKQAQLSDIDRKIVAAKSRIEAKKSKTEILSQDRVREIVLEQLLSQGWQKTDGPALATKVYDTINGAPVIAWFSSSDGYNYGLRGEFYSKGENVLGSAGFLIKTDASAEDVALQAKRFSDEVDVRMKNSFAYRMADRTAEAYKAGYDAHMSGSKEGFPDWVKADEKYLNEYARGEGEASVDKFKNGVSTMTIGIGALRQIKNFMSPSQYITIANSMKGSEGKYFSDKAVEMANIIENMPSTGETEHTEDPIAHLHYFNPSMDWYITEKDAGVPVDAQNAMGDYTGGSDEQLQAFGYSKPDNELAYISIKYITDHGAELDLHFDPIPLSKVKEQGEGGNVQTPEIPTEDRVAKVDAAYKFDTATDSFKDWVSDSIESTQYSPFFSAKAIDEQVKKWNGKVEWFLDDGQLDSINNTRLTFNVLDSAGDNIVGKIIFNGAVIGRVLMYGDGKAVILLRNKGDDRVQNYSAKRQEYWEAFASQDNETLATYVDSLFAWYMDEVKKQSGDLSTPAFSPEFEKNAIALGMEKGPAVGLAGEAPSYIKKLTSDDGSIYSITAFQDGEFRAVFVLGNNIPATDGYSEIQRYSGDIEKMSKMYGILFNEWVSKYKPSPLLIKMKKLRDDATEFMNDIVDEKLPDLAKKGISADAVIAAVEALKTAINTSAYFQTDQFDEFYSHLKQKYDELLKAVDDANNAVLESMADKLEQTKYLPFDQSQIKMPTAKQLKINGIVKGLALIPPTGWSNGHIMDLIMRPKLVTDAIEKYYNDENSQSIRRIPQELVDKIVNQVKSNTKKIEPIAYYDDTIADKGMKNPIRCFVLSTEKRDFALNIYSAYFSYFEKIHKNCDYYAGENSKDAILVKKAGEIVGIVMPMQIGPNVLNRAMKARGETVEEQAPAVAETAPTPEPVQEQAPEPVAAVEPEKTPEVAPEMSPEKKSALDLLESIVSGNADMMDSELNNRLEAVYGVFKDDPEVMAKFEQAASAYASFMIDQAKAVATG